MIKKISLIVCSALFFFSCEAGEIKAQYFVPIEKTHPILTGRYESKKEYISFSNSGTGMILMAPEKEFYIWIEETSTDSSQCNWLLILSDTDVDAKIQLKPGKHMYKIAASPNSFIELIKATEALVGEVRVYGLQLHNPYIHFDFDIASQKYIQFIGNSITCGYGNMVSIPPAPYGNPLTGFHAVNENAHQSYAMQTARRLKMNPVLVSFSGKGMYRNFGGDTTETMPEIYERIHLQNKNSAVWDHSKQIPDIIVINLGTNDYFDESRNEPLNDSVFVQTYIQFVTRLLTYYPRAKIICANGSMLNDGWPEGKKCWSRIQANLKKVQKHFQAKGNTHLYTFFFTPQSAPYGEDFHPSLATHTKMAEELSTFIQTVVNK